MKAHAFMGAAEGFADEGRSYTVAYMADDQSRPDEYRERATLLRQAAEKMDSTEGRQLFLQIADEFDQLADSIDRSRLH